MALYRFFFEAALSNWNSVPSPLAAGTKFSGTAVDSTGASAPSLTVGLPTAFDSGPGSGGSDVGDSYPPNVQINYVTIEGAGNPVFVLSGLGAGTALVTVYGNRGAVPIGDRITNVTVTGQTGSTFSDTLDASASGSQADRTASGTVTTGISDDIRISMTRTGTAGHVNAILVDFTPASSGPTLSGGAPTGTTSANPNLTFTTDTASGTARIVVDSAGNLSGVTATQVLAGQKANGAAAAHDTGTVTVSGTTVSSNAIAGLSSGSYTAAAAQHSGGNSNVLSWVFTVDATAPVFTAGPSATAITDTGATITGTSSEAGVASLLVTLQSASQPSDASFDVSTETTSITANTPFSIPHTGESPGAARKAWVQLKDATGNRTTASVNFTTTARAVTLQLVGSAGTLANKSLRAWSRQTISGAAVDGGSTGLNVTTDGNGILVLTGLTIPAGPGVVTLEDPADTYNSHNYHVVFD